MALPPEDNLNRDELRTLYAIAHVLNSALDLDTVLQMAIDRVIEFVKADRGFLVLVDREKKPLGIRIARDRYARTIPPEEFSMSYSAVLWVVRNETLLTDSNLPDPTQSMIRFGIQNYMCAPLLGHGKLIGVVYVDRRSAKTPFHSRHCELLLAFCHQAAIAIENAQLFTRVNDAKQYMDNVFTSLANGVITTDAAGMITGFNMASGLILNLKPEAVIGKHYREAFNTRPQINLIKLLDEVQIRQKGDTVLANMVEGEIPGRSGRVYLNLSLSSLRDARGVPIGSTLVLDDQTEQKRREIEVEGIRRIFRHYVHPHVVEQLIKNPKTLRLGGETREITVIFADIRGYTRLNEILEPEKVMNLLNSYLRIMVEKIWEQEGTVTAFMGDALMAIFNAPLRQENHPLRAVRATWNMRQAVLEYQSSHPQQIPISFGFGISTGLATVGNVGSEKHIQNYTAIGDVVNVASRLQAKATGNQILLNDSTYLEVLHNVQVEPPFILNLKNRAMQAKVRQLKGLI